MDEGLEMTRRQKGVIPGVTDSAGIWRLNEQIQTILFYIVAFDIHFLFYQMRALFANKSGLF